MINLSAETSRRIKSLYAEGDWERVSNLLLTKCGDNLPGIESAYEELAERVRFAVLKLSKGDANQLAKAVEGAAIDFRYALVEAGFAENVKVHLDWEPEASAGT